MTISVSLGFDAKDVARAVQRGDVILIIDVLRCCSTIVTALANGAKLVIPTRTIKEARLLRRKHPEFILAGERIGIKPDGFDFGNSPLEFSPREVKGKHILLTTTNGTKAISLSRKAIWVLIGTFLNAEAVAKAALKIARREETGISLMPAGTRGLFSLEDFICAGAITEGLLAEKAEHSDAVLAALLAFQKSRKSLGKVLQSGRHARYLTSQGFEEDVKFCCRLNVFQIVPFLRGEIVVPLNLSATET